MQKTSQKPRTTAGHNNGDGTLEASQAAIQPSANTTQADGTAEQRGGFHRVLDAKLILSIVATGVMSFSGVVVETAMNVTFPTLMTEFNVTTSTVQWMTTAYLLVLAAIIPVSSFLNRRFTTKRIFQVAMCFYIAGITCGASAVSFPMLLCGRILEGVGTGMALPLMYNVIQEQAPFEYMGTMMGIGSLVTALAPAVGPSLGGWISESFGWRWIFLCLLPVLVVAFILGSLSLRQSHPTEKAHLDVPGWLVLIGSFFSLVLATSEMSNLGATSPLLWCLFVLFVVLLALFTRHESRTGQPLIHLDVFRRRGFTLSLASLMLLQFIILGLSFLIPNYSQLVMGTGATEAGSILLPGCVLGAALAPISGRILDRFGAKPPILTGCTCALVATVLFFAFSANLHTGAAIGIYLVMTLGQGLMVGTTMTNGLSQLKPELKADGNAVINTLQQLSGAIGTSVVTAVVNAAQEGVGQDALTQATLVGTREAYLLLVIVAVLSLAAQVVNFAGQRKAAAA